MSKPVQFDNDDNISYELLTWEELGAIADDLADKISQSQLKFDRIVALATGGHTMSKALKDYLDISMISSVQISFYTGIGKRGETPIITQSLATNIEGENLLIFDDVNDTGATLETARKYLEMRGAGTIKTATLLHKPNTSFPSDYFGKSVDTWIIFPDEIRETITLLTDKWQAQDMELDEIDGRLREIGFTDKQLSFVRSS